MSRPLMWTRITAILFAGSFLACAVESPVAPIPDTPEDEVVEARAEPSPQAATVVEDEYIVIFRDDRQIPPGLVRRLAGDHDLALKHEYEHVLHGFAAKIPPQALAGLRNNPFIERIEPNLEYTLDAPAQAAAPVPVPEDGLRVRLVADDLPPGEVGVWPNRGSEGDAVQSTATRRPSYLGPAPEFGGHASVSLNEGSDNDEALEIGGVAGHGSGTLFVVFRPESTNASNSTMFAPYGTSRRRTNMATARNDGSSPMDYSTTSLAWIGGTLTPAAGQTHVGVWRVDSGIWADLQLNGQPAGGAEAPTGMPAFDRYIIGMATPSSKERFDGWVAELVFYDRALPDCERDNLVAALGQQYGVAVAVTGGPDCSGLVAPAGLAALVISSGSIDLSWLDRSNGEDGFRVERRLGQDGTWQEISETGPDATAYSDAGLNADTEYCYRVSAFIAEGTSSPSNVACATTAAEPSSPPLSVPEDGLRVRLVADDLPPGEVGVWPNRGSEGDAVQATSSRQPSYLGPSPQFGGHASVSLNEGSDNDEVLIVGDVASHESGTLFVVFRPESTNASNSTMFAPYGTSQSRTNMATARNDGSSPMDYSTTSLAWIGGTLTPAEGETYVGVWRVDSGEWADLQLNGQPAGGAEAPTGMPSFDRYIIGMSTPSASERFDGWVAELVFYDRALPDCERDNLVAALGQQYGVSVAVTGGPCAPPPDPTGLSATAVGYDAIDLAWTDASTNEDGFRVERRLGQNGAWEQVAETEPDATTYQSRSLIQQTEYCYRVSAFNGDGSSGFSDAACATTEAAPPGACVDTGGHDDLADLYGIEAIGAPANQIWASTLVPGCEITPWYFGLDSGIDSDHPDLNVIEAASFVSAEPDHDGEDGNGHGTHTAGTAAARDGNGGVVGVAPGARIHSFRVCEDGGSCQTADMVAAMDEVMARKLASPDQPMVANMSIGGPADNVIDQALRNSVNAGIVYAVAAGNGILGACIFPGDASNVSPARVGNDEILPNGNSKGDGELLNGILTTTSHNASFADVNCNYGAPVSVAAPGYQIRSTWLNDGYNTISGTSMATPHAAGAALLYLQTHPEATPAEVEAAIISRLRPWTTNESPNAAGRLNVDGL